MVLSDLVHQGLDAPIAAIRRHAISLAIAATAAIGALFYGASALMLLLEAGLGPIGARLLVAATLLCIAIAGYFAPRLLRAANKPAPAEDRKVEPGAEGLTRDQRIAMVIEALLLGFSVGSRKPAENTDGRK